MKTEILYEDKFILVVYKPAGIATQTSKIGQSDVVSELKNYLSRESSSSYIGVVHRLDQPVEGLLVFAKDKRTAAELTARLQRQGEESGLHKHYYAVVCGKPSEEEGELVDYMYKDEHNKSVIVEPLREERAKSVQPGKNQADTMQSGTGRKPVEVKKAVLRYQWISTAEDLSLLDIRILTGRFHQIRAQMANAGFPLLGDVKYGGTEVASMNRRPGQGLALCAYRLEFFHPVTKENLQFDIKPRGRAFTLFAQTR